MLVVCDTMPSDPDSSQLPDGIWLIRFSDLAGRINQPPCPDIVLCPLIGESFDAFDVACILASAHYDGRLRVLTSDLPAAPMIRDEIRGSFPDLDFNIFFVAEDGDLDPI